MKQLEGITSMRTLLLALVVVAAPAFAGEDHCHSSSTKGVVQDDPSATNMQDCKKKGGKWGNHDAHCHASGDGSTQEYPQASTQSQCAKAGGKWFAHGHDKLNP